MPEVTVVAIATKSDRYIFVYRPEYRSEVLRVLGRFASDPRLDFSWHDAAVVSKLVREAAGMLRDNGPEDDCEG